MTRPDSDFDSAERGKALIQYSKQYRTTKPKATLSEIADSFATLAKIAANGNGKGGANVNTVVSVNLRQT